MSLPLLLAAEILASMPLKKKYKHYVKNNLISLTKICGSDCKIIKCQEDNTLPKSLCFKLGLNNIYNYGVD